MNYIVAPDFNRGFYMRPPMKNAVGMSHKWDQNNLSSKKYYIRQKTCFVPAACFRAGAF